VAQGNGAGYGVTTSSTDSYYSVDGLASDSYKVAFYGQRLYRRCGYIQYSTVYYNSKSRLEDADLLTLLAPNRNNPGLQSASSEAESSRLENINAILSYNIYWQLYDSSGKRLFSYWLVNGDPGAFIRSGGAYTIAVAADANMAGTY
jgi:hypothetical protein